jgi:hypothetical protein
MANRNSKEVVSEFTLHNIKDESTNPGKNRLNQISLKKNTNTTL